MMDTKTSPPFWKRLLLSLAVASPFGATALHASDSSYVVGDSQPARERAQHLAFLGVNRWHAWGFQGDGIKIAVLDSGFRGYHSYLGKALPARVTCRSFRGDGNLEAKDSQHGILCGEVIHALAPRAELLFANWEPDAPEQFLEAVRWARRQGARIISCSIIMPSWSDGEGGGPVNQKLGAILGKGAAPDDVLFIACAGNTADRHWSGTFHAGDNGLHEWTAHVTSNRLIPWGTDPVSVELYGHLTAEYDLHVQEASSGTEVGESQHGHGMNADCQIVRFTPGKNASYRVRVGLRKGKAGPFHLVVLGGGLSIATAQGSISCPADCPEVITVGAVDKEGKRATYSSCGPNSRQLKPDLVAPVPFPSLCRQRPFSGTSAAAPQAAALAGLLWSMHRDWTPDQVRAALRQSAVDLGPPGHDWETGYGRIVMPKDLMPLTVLSSLFAIQP
jgi:subtilisin family serine protease